MQCTVSAMAIYRFYCAKYIVVANLVIGFHICSVQREIASIYFFSLFSFLKTTLVQILHSAGHVSLSHITLSRKARSPHCCVYLAQIYNHLSPHLYVN